MNPVPEFCHGMSLSLGVKVWEAASDRWPPKSAMLALGAAQSLLWGLPAAGVGLP